MIPQAGWAATPAMPAEEEEKESGLVPGEEGRWSYGWVSAHAARGRGMMLHGADARLTAAACPCMRLSAGERICLAPRSLTHSGAVPPWLCMHARVGCTTHLRVDARCAIHGGSGPGTCAYVLEGACGGRVRSPQPPPPRQKAHTHACATTQTCTVGH